MTMSNRCKWLSFAVMSLTVILLLTFFYTISKNKCPHEGELRYRETGECFEKGMQGPCENNLVFAEEDPTESRYYGSCSCPYMEFNRTILHHNGFCHYVFTQAYCNEGQWLNVSVKGEPVCETNPCLQHSRNGFEDDKTANEGEIDMKSNDQQDINMHKHMTDHQIVHGNDMQMNGWVPIKGGRCARLGMWTEGCPVGSVVMFHRDYILPSCFEPPKQKLSHSLSAIGVGAYTGCPIGSRRSFTGRCQPTFDFDFEESREESSSENKNN